METTSVVFNNETKSKTSEIIDVRNYPQVVIKIDKITEGSLQVLSTDNSIIPIVNMVTGNSLISATDRGQYLVNTAGLKNIMFKLTHSYLDDKGSTATVSITKLTEVITVTPIEKNLSAKVAIGKVLHTITGTKRPIFLDDDNVIWATSESVVNGAKLHKSTDWGATWSDIYNWPKEDEVVVYKGWQMGNGNIVVVGSSGKIWTSDDGGTTFTATLDLTGVKPHSLFGGRAYKNILVLTEYKADKTFPATSDGVWLSEDYGATFTEVFNNDVAGQTTAWHVHDACYDPYEDMLLVCTGDGTLAKMIYYSKDMGQTWYTSTPFGSCTIQATQIIPKAKCILFSSDARYVTVQRYNRPPGGTQEGVYWTFENALTVYNGWGKKVKKIETLNADATGKVVLTEYPITSEGISVYDAATYVSEDNPGPLLPSGTLSGKNLTNIAWANKQLSVKYYYMSEVPIASQAGIDWVNDIDYFGWALVPSSLPGGTALKRAQVFATRDGYKFYSVYVHPVTITGSGLVRCLDPNVTGDFLAYVEETDSIKKFIHMNNSMWV